MMKGTFTRMEKVLWGVSAGAIVLSFLVFDRENRLTLAASLVGVTSLICCAKGYPVGQGLMILFSLLYGVISWLRNPFEPGRAEVRVSRVPPRERLLALALTALVTWAFYYVLRALGTASLIPSTLSVATSFLAADGPAAGRVMLRNSAMYGIISQKSIG